MALGDGIRRNIASVDPTERAMLRDAFVELNHRYFPGSRTDAVPGGVSWWFKQDEIHQATHVHNGPEFIPWHRVIVNRIEAMLRSINPQLSLHYWDWTQDPTAIPNANLGGGTTGTLNLFTPDFMGYGGNTPAEIGEPWLGAGYYVPGASPHRDSSNNPADPPQSVTRSVVGSPASISTDNGVLAAGDYAQMRLLLEDVHDDMHGFVRMGGQHISFRDPFVFLLHSNVDRLFARWQTDPAHPERLEPDTVYGTESNLDVVVDVVIQNVNHLVEPWSTGHSFDQFGVEHFTRPWYAPEDQGEEHNYKHPSVLFPPCYDTNHTAVPVVQVMNPGTPPVINFNDVPTNETTMRAAVFRIYGCGDVTMRVKPGAGPAAPFSVLHPASQAVTVHHGPNLYAEARIWLAYKAGPAGVPVPDGSVTFECPENGKEFVFVLKANAIDRPKVAVMLALDQSWSMSYPAGTLGATRLEVLKDAARLFMELVQQGNAVGLVRFDHDSYPVNDPTFPGLPVTEIMSDDLADLGRIAAIAAVTSHTANPAGNTSVGDGIDRARQVLDALPAGVYLHKAMIALTDGLENQQLWIDDVPPGTIDARTFAIGLGNEQQVNTVALRALANGTGGELLLTGLLSSSLNDYFRLRKHFLQILAGVTNTDIVRDPLGFLAPGAKVRIPFYLTEADIACLPLVMTDENVVDFSLETPDGTPIHPAMAPGLGMSYGVGAQTKHFRFTLPVALGAGQQQGLWYAVLAINAADFKKALSRLRDRKDGSFQRFATHGARYCVVVQSYSNLRMAARVEQSGFEPGADLRFRAVLTEYGVPVDKRARVRIELTRPGGSVVVLSTTETEPGIFERTAQAAYTGVYHVRFLANGVTLRGAPFTREQTASAAVWQGGDRPYEPPRDAGKADWCRFLECLLNGKNLSRELQERLKKEGINLDGIRECIRAYCRKR
ncbi:MAG: tyrosinase family protein [Gemmataceae bacterium]|nr:tyrosinase family protein [Gemmataceae bacterium]